MIEIERHIEILLLDNDCVIVPNLGGFMAHHVEAHFDDGSFLPPQRTLGFNSQLKINDSLLAQSYIEAYDISYPEAIRRIENEVEELKQHIANDGEYELNDIGTLYLNESGSYLFEPCKAGILTPSLYGLSSFDISPLDSTNEDTIEMYHGENVAIANDNAKTTSIASEDKTAKTDKGTLKAMKPLEPITAIDDSDDEESTIKIKVAWLRNAVAIAAAIIAFFVISEPVSNSRNLGVDAKKMQSAVFYNLMPKDTHSSNFSVDISKANNIGKGLNTETTNNKGKENIKNDIADVTKKESVTDNSETPREKNNNSELTDKKLSQNDTDLFCIVIASHVLKKNAQDYVNNLHTDGYDQAYVYTHNNIVRVVYGHYKSEEEACNNLRAIRGNKHFEQAWVYKKK